MNGDLYFVSQDRVCLTSKSKLHLFRTAFSFNNGVFSLCWKMNCNWKVKSRISSYLHLSYKLENWFNQDDWPTKSQMNPSPNLRRLFWMLDIISTKMAMSGSLAMVYIMILQLHNTITAPHIWCKSFTMATLSKKLDNYRWRISWWNGQALWKSCNFKDWRNWDLVILVIHFMLQMKGSCLNYDITVSWQIRFCNSFKYANKV